MKAWFEPRWTCIYPSQGPSSVSQHSGTDILFFFFCLFFYCLFFYLSIFKTRCSPSALGRAGGDPAQHHPRLSNPVPSSRVTGFIYFPVTTLKLLGPFPWWGTFTSS